VTGTKLARESNGASPALVLRTMVFTQFDPSNSGIGRQGEALRDAKKISGNSPPEQTGPEKHANR